MVASGGGSSSSVPQLSTQRFTSSKATKGPPASALATALPMASTCQAFSLMYVAMASCARLLVLRPMSSARASSCSLVSGEVRTAIVTDFPLLLVFVVICLQVSTSADGAQIALLRTSLERYDWQRPGNGGGKLFGCDGHHDEGLEGQITAGRAAGSVAHMAWDCGKAAEARLAEIMKMDNRNLYLVYQIYKRTRLFFGGLS